MLTITTAQLESYRAQTFCLRPELRLRAVKQALDYVNARGFIFFWPIKDALLPSLWTAVAGDRPVADQHDDPGHVTWGWKDEMLARKQWYYAKVLRGKATLISLAVAPYFYALSENFGDPQQDYLDQYAAGLLSREAKQVYEALLREGPLDTVRLRRVTQMASKAGASPFGRALTQLQRDFKILPVGVAQAGAWRYSFIYAPVHHHFPHLPQQARAITRGAARQELARRYFASVGAATAADLRRLFQWKPRDAETAVQACLTNGTLMDCGVDGVAATCYAVPDAALLAENLA